MTAVISFDRRDGLGPTSSSAPIFHLMQGSSHAKERTDAGKTENRKKQSSQAQQQRPEQQTQSHSYRHHQQHEHQQQHERRRRMSTVRNEDSHSSPPVPSTSMPSGLAGPESPRSDRTTYVSRAPMSTMRDRYRYNDDDTAAGEPSSNRLRGEGGDDWRSSAGIHKRRHSQRSPSRPRSQQGSQAAQIANVKEAERENEQSGRFSRIATHEEANALTGERGFQRSGGFASGSQDSPRKIARLDSSMAASRMSEPFSDWPSKRAPHMSESEPTSASSSRVPITRSMHSSTDDDEHGAGVTAAVEYGDPDEAETNYTWRQRASRDAAAAAAAAAAAGNPTSPSHRPSNRLPPLLGGFRGGNPPPSSAPVSATAEGHSSERSSSPHPPRLPGFAVLSPFQTQSATLGQQHSRYSPPLPSQQRQHSHQRSESFGMPSYVTSPRMPGRSSVSGNSPSLSHTSHATPGQAFIHPSLAGLPGAGGGAGSKQQPSFVSKLYSMLEDDTIEEMIAWGPSGTTFSVANPAEFAKVVLPNWFKHSNWQSFVRQLNMYGFHKVNHTYQGTPEEEIQVWEFKHPSFRRGEVHLLSEIKRKSSRHKRQDSLSRSMTTGGEYDMGAGSPSPEMGMTRIHVVGGGIGHPLGAPPPPPGFGVAHGGPQAHPGQQHPSAQHPYLRSAEPAYRGEYVDAVPPPPPTQALLPPRMQHAGTGGPQPGSGAGLQQHQLVDQQQQQHHLGIVAPGGDNVAVRMDDLSDRIDAIIRHATYLEGQLRSVSDQLFHAQQNEASLRTHVHHLESQMRSLSDQLYQQQRHMMVGQRPPSPPPHVQQQQQQPHGALPPPSPSSRDAGRFQVPAPPSSSVAQSYPERSPVMANPSYATRGAAASGGSGRSTPASSADAYTKLGPPPPPPSGSGSGVRMHEEMSPR